MLAFLRALVTAGFLALFAAPTASASLQQSTFEGRIASATWLYCDAAGCFTTTATLTISETGPGNQICIDRDPSPIPSGSSSRITACSEPASAGVIADDLSAARWIGTETIFSRDCDDQGVCHPASYVPIGRSSFDVSWTATAAAERYRTKTEQRDVERITGEICRYSSVAKGSRRAATASLITTDLPDEPGWQWPLGDLTSASIASVKSVTTRNCKYPY